MALPPAAICLFGYWPQNNLGPKTTYFRRLRNSMATLRANIPDTKLDRDNRDKALETAKGPIVQKFHELLSLNS